MRKVVLDIETTGLHLDTNKIFEIGCVELWENIPTGNYFHVYINPTIPLSKESIEITGITDDILINKPLFNEIKNEFLEFLQEDPIIAHNSDFDSSFIYKELGYKLPNLIIDSLAIARKQFPGKKNNLDALCKRFHVDNSTRTVHGALLDADLLAKIYYFLTISNEDIYLNNQIDDVQYTYIPQKKIELTNEEQLSHIYFIEKYKLKSF